MAISTTQHQFDVANLEPHETDVIKSLLVKPKLPPSLRHHTTRLVRQRNGSCLLAYLQEEYLVEQCDKYIAIKVRGMCGGYKSTKNNTTYKQTIAFIPLVPRRDRHS